MIGRLLQSAASSFGPHDASRPPTPLESVTEEAHTRDLLFPDPASFLPLQGPGPAIHGPRLAMTAKDAASFDDHGDLDLSFPSDVRTIIAQDANARYGQPQVLFDSDPPEYGRSRASSPILGGVAAPSARALDRNKSVTSPDALPARYRHTASSSTISVSQKSPSSPRSPESRFRSFFGDTRGRQPTHRSMTSEIETPQGKLSRDAKEETDALLACMFGAPGFRLEPSVKLHVFPQKASDDRAPPLGENDRMRPLSSCGLARHRTLPTRSTSAVEMSNGSVGHGRSNAWPTHIQRTLIMCTRLFAVPLVEKLKGDERQELGTESKEPIEILQNARPIHPDPSLQSNAPPSIKQKKTPMFAIAIVLRLPPDCQDSRLRSRSSHHTLSTAGSSYNEREAFSTGVLSQSPLLSSDARQSSDMMVNPQVSLVLRHWNVLAKVLDNLEFEARAQLTEILGQSMELPVLAIPTPAKNRKTKPTSQQSVYAMPDCLQYNSHTKHFTDIWAQRLVNGLCIRRVVTGQERWGAWREEARWIHKWARSREQPALLANFLSAFLGTHLDWLHATYPPQVWTTTSAGIGPRPGGITHAPPRTVILANDKMAARRLIFLVSLFLRPSATHPQPKSFRETCLRFSESPLPSSVDHGYHLNSAKPLHPQKSGPTRGRGHGRSVSFSLLDSNDDNGASDHTGGKNCGSRRGSDTRSIVASSLPIPDRSQGSRKASFSTVVAESTTPVPHFTSPAPVNVGVHSPTTNMGPAQSLASLALTHNLTRSGSSSGSTHGSGGRWGSVMSGFWGTGKASSTGESDILSASPSSFPGSGFGSRRLSSAAKLSKMVEEASEIGGVTCGPMQDSRRPYPDSLSLEPRKPGMDLHSGPAAQDVPLRQNHNRLPPKLSWNEDEGYIDVTAGGNGSLGSSLASSVASVWRTSYHPGGFAGISPPPASLGPRAFQRPGGDTKTDVAGWLQAFNSDFSVQALRPYADLMKDVKAAMQAEARLAPSDEVTAEWSHFSTCLVADTVHGTVEWLCLRRRRTQVRGKRSEGGTPRSEQERLASEDEVAFVSEPVTDSDTTLGEALARILDQSGDGSAAHSTASSPRRSGRPAAWTATRLQRSTSAAEREAAFGLALGTEANHEACKRTILGALEEIVKNIFDDLATPGEREKTGSTVLRDGIRRWAGAEGMSGCP